MIVLVVLGLAGVAVLGAVVLLAMGRGGELAATHPDYPPLPLGSDGRPVTGAEAAYLRLPRTLWGYQPDLADEAVRRLARALAEREAEVAALQREIAELRYQADGPVGALFGLQETAPPDGGDPRDADLAATGIDDSWAVGATPRPDSPPDTEEPRDANDRWDTGEPQDTGEPHTNRDEDDRDGPEGDGPPGDGRAPDDRDEGEDRP